MPNLKGKVVAVDWDDAWQSENYFSEADIEAEEGKLLRSYGLVILDNKKGLALAMDDLRPTGDARFRDVKFIPRGMVRKVKILR